MKENWYALLISIVCGVPPEMAFEMLNGNFYKNTSKREFITDDDIEDMIKLKKSMTYKELAEMYGVSKYGIFVRIKRYKKKKVDIRAD